VLGLQWIENGADIPSMLVKIQAQMRNGSFDDLADVNLEGLETRSRYVINCQKRFVRTDSKLMITSDAFHIA
jgi:hypothetical protein